MNYILKFSKHQCRNANTPQPQIYRYLSRTFNFCSSSTIQLLNRMGGDVNILTDWTYLERDGISNEL